MVAETAQIALLRCPGTRSQSFLIVLLVMGMVLNRTLTKSLGGIDRVLKELE